MAPLLEGSTLGEKLRSYNHLVKEAISNNNQNFELILSEDDDISSLIKIDIEATNRKVDFILQVLKCEDMLYVSRAINRISWLITDQTYAHIITPDFLYTELFPHMTAVAINKLLLKIRIHLTDEKRGEAFYNYIKSRNFKTAFKWLHHCSIPFVEIEVRKHINDIPSHVFHRLFEKSISIFEIALTHAKYRPPILRESEFVVAKDPEKYLEIIEKVKAKDTYWRHTFRSNTTIYFMKKCPERIMSKFEIYYDAIDIATFIKYVKNKKDINEFLLKQVKNDKVKSFFTFHNIQYLFKLVSKENLFEYIKKFIINRENVESFRSVEEELMFYFAQKLKKDFQITYKWYKFAPFSIAFVDLIKLIRLESVPALRSSMLKILLLTAGQNAEDIRTVLNYYMDKHINEPFKFKIQFIDCLLTQIDTHKIDDETWNVINQFFHSLEVYIKSENDVQSCVKAIIIRNVIQGQNVPEIIKSKFRFDTLVSYKRKINDKKDRDALFSYLYDFVNEEIKNNEVTTETEFSNCVFSIQQLSDLFNDWEKDVNQYPSLLHKIRELTRIKTERNWGQDLSSIYIKNKKWRKELFEVSILLAPSDKVCVNVLKHDPGLLVQLKEEMMKIYCDDHIRLTQMFKKIRVYWPDSHSKELRALYLGQIDKTDNLKAHVFGLCLLLPQKDLKLFVDKYIPNETKINWSDVDENLVHLRKHIAMTVYKARPLTPMELILPYAVGDYLQYAVPSLSSILYQLSGTKAQQYISKLLDAPVSLQKFGIRNVHLKLDTDTSKTIFSNIWNSSKNSSIRTVLFTSCHGLLSKEPDEYNIKNIWELISTFIDNLTTEEDNKIFKTLGKVEVLPLTIQPQYFMKSYTFLDALPEKHNVSSITDKMAEYSLKIMDMLDDDFVPNVLLKKIFEKIKKDLITWHDNKYVSSYILGNKSEAVQVRRCTKILVPLLEKCMTEWTTTYEKKFSVKINTQTLLKELVLNMKEYTIKSRNDIPVKVFTNIQSQLEATLSYETNYVFLTTSKLVVEFTKLMYDNKQTIMSTPSDDQLSDDDTDKILTELNKCIAPSFAKVCICTMREDFNKFYPSIFMLFSLALQDFFKNYLNAYYPFFTNSLISCRKTLLDYYKHLIEYGNDKETYLMMCPLIRDIVEMNDPDDEKELKEIQRIIFSNASKEIKLHYYTMFDNEL